MTPGNGMLLVFFVLGLLRIASHARGGSWDAVSLFGLGCTVLTGIALAYGVYESRRGDATEQLRSE
jgi:hypothetical protein